MNWTLYQLEAFVLSVNHGSFSAAARKLGRAQSRVSTAIANLEVDLGFELFDRSAKLPVLTKHGEDMFIQAQAVLEQCQRLQSRAMTLNTGQEIALTVAMDEAVPVNAFELLFEQVAIQFPLLKLTIINGSRDDIASWVDEGKADMGIVFHVRELPGSLEFMSIGQFRQSLIVSPKHALAKISSPSIADLNQYRQLVIRDRVGDSQAKALSPNHWYIDSYYYMTALVIRGVGWALVPEHVVNAEWYSGDVVELSTEYIPDPLLVEMGVVNRRDKAYGPVMEWFFIEIESMFKSNKLQTY
ncbi:LysR family transcriptional regulator [Shewanella violacea]|uniref:Transcriptional regulator, LysR family n=1 Tax=Shewanella violacea (strain JCM 10179 / CIP 106290 / LMG 19151 / DSS12) TaxID=637905 RepID=D4ZDK4_SHEVD|nr:LysR family transcriptional regulator [Shewanella violacea]BAJ00126.1 transcriptional regulator, LysR family [Shewanella violacea DSS12]